MAESVITKRLLISGLIPAITKDDITRLLGSFGSVKAADGFGLVDALGRPRKYAFVTLETTPSKLGKCMNVLSGSVWRGAKLRLGEARLDYKERIARENQRAAEEPPKKRRRRCAAVHAEDMSLVTPENVSERPGWNVSPLGRITHPIVMRPDHPLPAIQEASHRTKSDAKNNASGAKKRKHGHKPITHSTRAVIDMAEWGSTYLKGIFLDSGVVLPGKSTLESGDLVENDDGDIDSAEEFGSDESLGTNPAEPLQNVPPSPTSLLQPLPLAEANERSPFLLDALVHPVTESHEPYDCAPYEAIDIQHEKDQALSLLASLFGGNSKNDDDWCGNESIGSDIDMEELVKGDRDFEEDIAYEEVPVRQKKDRTPMTIQDNSRQKDTSTSNEAIAASSTPKQVVPIPKTAITSKSTLKDLFAPKEDAGFSLLDHLDLDVEMNDDDLPFLAEKATYAEPVVQEEAVAVSHVVQKTGRQPAQPRIILNSKHALFFPSATPNVFGKARQRDVYDVVRDNGWFWRDPAVGFWNRESEEEITKKWEESRGELTKQWKKKWREAGKARNRKRFDGDEM